MLAGRGLEDEPLPKGKRQTIWLSPHFVDPPARLHHHSHASWRSVSSNADFADPPASARPWVYWMWMDGNLSREGLTADLEAMQSAGIGGVMIMEVDVGVPKGPVKFMSPNGGSFSSTSSWKRNGWVCKSRSTPAPAGPAAADRGSSRSNPCNTSSPARSKSPGRRTSTRCSRDRRRANRTLERRSAPGITQGSKRVLPRRRRARVSNAGGQRTHRGH